MFNVEVVVALAILAGLMAGGNSYIFVQFFPRRGGTPNLGRAILVAGLLGSSLCVWLAVMWAVVVPSFGAWLAVFLGMNSMMVAVGVWFVAIFLRAEERMVPSGSWGWAATLSLLVIGNELFMGTSFVGAVGGPGALLAGSTPTLISGFTASVNSLWFFWAMLANLTWLVLWLPLARNEKEALLGLSSVTIVGPWVLWSPFWGPLALLLVVVMVALLVLRSYRATTQPTVRYSRIVTGSIAGLVTVAGGATIAGLTADSPFGSLAWASAAFFVLFFQLLFLSQSALKHTTPAAASTSLPLTAPSAASE
ncbi:MAG: hypothetical protein WB778_02145 [Thermoplasmata archaeon]